MGCNDYYDPARDREDENWRRNCQLINDCNCIRKSLGGLSTLYGGDFAACADCGALLWCGDLRRESDLPFVRSHHQWHSTLANP